MTTAAPARTDLPLAELRDLAVRFRRADHARDTAPTLTAHARAEAERDQVDAVMAPVVHAAIHADQPDSLALTVRSALLLEARYRRRVTDLIHAGPGHDGELDLALDSLRSARRTLADVLGI